jgi:hypothetical protein
MITLFDLPVKILDFDASVNINNLNGLAVFSDGESTNMNISDQNGSSTRIG